MEHKILVSGATHQPAWIHTPFTLHDEMKGQVENMLRKVAIRESTSPWFAPAILCLNAALMEKQIYILLTFSCPEHFDEIRLLTNSGIRRNQANHSAPHASQNSTATAGSCKWALRRNSVRELHSQSCPGTSNLTDFLSDFQIIPQDSRDLWT